MLCEYSPVVSIRQIQQEVSSVLAALGEARSAFATGDAEVRNMRVHKYYLLDKQTQHISCNQWRCSGQKYHSDIYSVKLQSCSLIRMISVAKSLRCVEGMQLWLMCQQANIWTKCPYCCWHEQKDTHCILRPSFNSVLPCILTTSSTKREICPVMIISIVLRDYSDHCLKSLNCNSPQKKVICSGKRPFHK